MTTAYEFSYVLKHADGTHITSSDEQGQLASCTEGAPELVPGLREHFRQLTVGATITASLEPSSAYGLHDSTKVHDLPKASFGDKVSHLTVGQSIMLRPKDTDPILGKVTAIHDATITLDCNHPLAGKALIYEITIKNVIHTD